MRYECHTHSTVSTTDIFIVSKGKSQFQGGSIEFIVNLKFVTQEITVTKIVTLVIYTYAYINIYILYISG